MSIQMLGRSLAVLLVFVALGYSAHPQPDDRSIMLVQDKRSPIVVRFTDDDLARVKRDVRYVVEKMRRSGVTCCGPKKRITEHIWVCCDGNRIRTANRTLIWALEQVWASDGVNNR